MIPEKYLTDEIMKQKSSYNHFTLDVVKTHYAFQELITNDKDVLDSEL